METSIELRFESLRIEIEKGEDILLKKIDSFEKTTIKNDTSLTMVSYEFPRWFERIPIGILIFDEFHEKIQLKLNEKLIFRSESTDSLAPPNKKLS